MADKIGTCEDNVWSGYLEESPFASFPTYGDIIGILVASTSNN